MVLTPDSLETVVMSDKIAFRSIMFRFLADLLFCDLLALLLTGFLSCTAFVFSPGSSSSSCRVMGSGVCSVGSTSGLLEGLACLETVCLLSAGETTDFFLFSLQMRIEKYTAAHVHSTTNSVNIETILKCK